MINEVRARIIGTGKYQPEGVLTNHDLEKMIDTSDKWIQDRTGIKNRRIATKDICTSDMAAHALSQAIDMAGIRPNDLDMIICGTISGDRPLPATAAYVQKKIGVSNHCAAFDIAAACAGFIYGLSIADSFIKQKTAKYVGVIGVELLSRVVDYEDRNTCVLFGDGAGAAVVARDSGGSGILSTHLFTDGSHADALTIPAGGSVLPASEKTVADRLHYVQMDGREVFYHAVRNITGAAKTALESSGVAPEEVDCVVAHQANIRILDAVSRRVGIMMDKFVLTLDRFGNTSSASIPITLDEAVRSGRIKEGDYILMTALGAGFSWGSALLKW